MTAPSRGPERTVETVRGPVAVAELGPTLMHEHISVTTVDPRRYFDAPAR